jgi:hypothetical protein
MKLDCDAWLTGLLASVCATAVQKRDKDKVFLRQMRGVQGK